MAKSPDVQRMLEHARASMKERASYDGNEREIEFASQALFAAGFTGNLEGSPSEVADVIRDYLKEA